MSHSKRGIDRRRVAVDLSFPLSLPSGETVASDRRHSGDRRQHDAAARQALFRKVPHSVIEPLVEASSYIELESGGQLLEPGELNHFLYVLLEGRLDVQIDSYDDQGTLDVYPGECVGEISIIDGKPATALVRAAQPSLLLAVPEDLFWTEFVSNPRIAKNFMKMFADRFRARNELMRQAVEEHLRYETIQKELGIAAHIQSSMLPQDFDLGPGIDAVAMMHPARHVGGDFYDITNLDEHHFYVAVGDVAGKGVPASLFMMRTMTLLRTEMLKRQPVEQAIGAVNRELCQGNEQCMFVTLAIVVIDRRDGRGEYVNAGHNPLLLGRGSSGFSRLPVPRGILAGVSATAAYRVQQLDLHEGDLLVLYTDGITEALNPDKELFTEQRCLEVLNSRNWSCASEVSGGLVGAVEAFASGAEQADDITLVVLRLIS